MIICMYSYILNNIIMTDIKLIAEIGWNHMGSLSLAEMIKAAKNSGADYAKFKPGE